MQPYNGGNDPQRGGVYSMGHGFYNPYEEPEWKREKKRIRGAGNGIGLASIGYVIVSAVAAGVLYAVLGMLNRRISLSAAAFTLKCAAAQVYILRFQRQRG
mgnify:CR=1 FL=1